MSEGNIERFLEVECVESTDKEIAAEEEETQADRDFIVPDDDEDDVEIRPPSRRSKKKHHKKEKKKHHKKEKKHRHRHRSDSSSSSGSSSSSSSSSSSDDDGVDEIVDHAVMLNKQREEDEDHQVRKSEKIRAELHLRRLEQENQRLRQSSSGSPLHRQTSLLSPPPLTSYTSQVWSVGDIFSSDRSSYKIVHLANDMSTIPFLDMNGTIRVDWANVYPRHYSICQALLHPSQEIKVYQLESYFTFIILPNKKIPPSLVNMGHAEKIEKNRDPDAYAKKVKDALKKKNELHPGKSRGALILSHCLYWHEKAEADAMAASKKMTATASAASPPVNKAAMTRKLNKLLKIEDIEQVNEKFEKGKDCLLPIFLDHYKQFLSMTATTIDSLNEQFFDQFTSQWMRHAAGSSSSRETVLKAVTDAQNLPNPVNLSEALCLLYKFLPLISDEFRNAYILRCGELIADPEEEGISKKKNKKPPSKKSGGGKKRKKPSSSSGDDNSGSSSSSDSE